MATVSNSIYLFILILIFNFLTGAYSSCKVMFPEEIDRIPKYSLSIGEWSLSVPFKAGYFYLSDGESVSATCETKFEGWENRYLNLFCKNGNALYLSNSYLRNVLKCNDLKWDIYKGYTAFSYCKADSALFVLASSSYDPPLLLAGVCYDIQKRILRTLNYRTHPGEITANVNDLNITPPSKIWLNKWEHINIDWIFKLDSSLENQLIEIGLKTDFIDLSNYEYLPLTQGGRYYKYFLSYGSFLEIAWWKNLRIYNWKWFTKAFDALTMSKTYDVFMGTSGTVRVPEKSNCQTEKNITFSPLRVDGKALPAYVWKYVKSLDQTEEFVFVGYNSPYFEFFDEKDIIFCKDICDQIMWLENVRSTFRYSFMGISFCCSVEEARYFLDGFPIEINEDSTQYNLSEETTESSIQEETEPEDWYN